MTKLFAVYLGGRAPKCNTELHDVVFVIGATIQSTYEQLMEQWFGTPIGLHLDSWVELNAADGHKISLSKTKPASGKNLYFINLGGYADGRFTELHENIFLVAETVQEAKSKAKNSLRNKLPGHLHTDDLHDVDDCLELGMIGVHHIVLEPATEAALPAPVNGYHIIPDEVVRDFLSRRRR